MLPRHLLFKSMWMWSINIYFTYCLYAFLNLFPLLDCKLLRGQEQCSWFSLSLFLKILIIYLVAPGFSWGMRYLQSSLQHVDSWLLYVGSSSLTKGWTQAPCFGSVEPQPLPGYLDAPFLAHGGYPKWLLNRGWRFELRQVAGCGGHLKMLLHIAVSVSYYWCYHNT